MRGATSVPRGARDRGGEAAESMRMGGVYVLGSPVVQESREAGGGPLRGVRQQVLPLWARSCVSGLGVFISTPRPSGMWIVGLGCSAPGSGYSIPHGGVGACHVCIIVSSCGVSGYLSVVLRP